MISGHDKVETKVRGWKEEEDATGYITTDNDACWVRGQQELVYSD